MGATPYDSGVTFRVWAKFASAVSVVGDFSAAPIPLFSEGTGYSSVDVPGATGARLYHFLIANPPPGAVLRRVDPYSRAFRTPGGDSLIAPSDTAYPLASYSTPPGPQLLTYELHVRP